MARKVQIEYFGAFYHVMGRANQGQAVFADDPAVWTMNSIGGSRVTQVKQQLLKAAED
jgi:hypothetical protein